MIIHSHDTCKDFSNITPATQRDNAEILKFLESISMTLKESNLDFSRGPDFFKLHKLQGIASTTFLFRNKDGNLVGVAVLTAVKGKYHGRDIVWAYASELRLSPEMDRATKAQFRPWYNTLVKSSKHLKDLHCPEFILSIVLDENEIAKKSLLNKKNPIVYRPLYQYKTRAIIGKIPSVKSSKNVVSFCTTQDQQELISLIEKSQHESGFCYSLEDIEYKLKGLNQTWNDFLIVRDNKNHLLACVLLTSDNSHRHPQLKFDDESKLKKVSFLLKFLGRPAIESDTRIKTSILAFMTFASHLSNEEKKEITIDLVRKSWDEKCRKGSSDKHHALIFSEENSFQFKNDFLKYGFLSQKIPGTVYQIIHKDDYRKQNLIRRPENKKMLIETSFL